MYMQYDALHIHVSIPYGAIRWFYAKRFCPCRRRSLVSIPYGAIRWFYNQFVLESTEEKKSFNPLRGNPVVLRRRGMTARELAVGFNPLRGNPVVLLMAID